MPTAAHDLAGAAVAYRAREAVALFDDYADLVAAIEELELAGFDRAQISLIRSCKAAEGVSWDGRSLTSGSSRTSRTFRLVDGLTGTS